jgi:hypothetical protein
MEALSLHLRESERMSVREDELLEGNQAMNYMKSKGMISWHD